MLYENEDIIENIRDFVESENKRMAMIDPKADSYINAEDMFKCAFIEPQEIKHLLPLENIKCNETEKIASYILNRFLNWVMIKITLPISSVVGIEFDSDKLLNDAKSGELYNDFSQEIIVQWWQETGSCFIQELTNLLVPHTLAGLADQVRLFNHFHECAQDMEDDEALFYVSDFFIPEWTMLLDRHGVKDVTEESLAWVKIINSWVAKTPPIEQTEYSEIFHSVLTQNENPSWILRTWGELQIERAKCYTTYVPAA